MKLDFKGNLEIVGEISGVMEGIAEALENNKYMDPITEHAHAQAAEEFDIAAAATANAGFLTHMYEFGTAGITRGPVKFPDPTSPAARLYKHVIVGGRGNYAIGYTFRPATQPNPQPTTRTTGVANKYLRKLSRRKYIFYNRAMVTETGMEVQIKPKRGPFLFVPFYGEAPKNPLNKRGFAMYNYASKQEPIQSVPGQSSAGTFTAFWKTWWEAQGERSMRVHAGDAIRFDIQKSLAKASFSSENKVKSVFRANIKQAAAMQEGKTEAELIARAKKRRGMVDR